MFLKSLEVFGFKNLKSKKYDFSFKLNAFLGKNGVGKTNLLDAIYYLAMTKSYFNFYEWQNIDFEENFFFINGVFQKGDKMDLISCTLKRGEKKTIKKNDKAYSRLMDHIGNYPIVIISPYDQDLIREGSESRRNFLDSMISQIDKQYLQNLSLYQRILAQRNALLKEALKTKNLSFETLEIYNEQLNNYGEKIFKKRSFFLIEFSKKFEFWYEKITQNKEKVRLIYKSLLSENSLKNLLENSRQKDLLLGYTTQGIHKDEIDFILNDFLIRKIGSQGQQKSFLIALKLAQFDFIKEKIGLSPILLLDDIFDKLDQNRIKYLIQLVNISHFGQVFLTDTHKDRTQNLLSNMEYEIFDLG
jgi:DNA replication and repair protein RecF